MSDKKVYHNQFAVEVKGGKEEADAVAERHGLVNLGQVGALVGHFLLESNKLEKRLESGIVIQIITSHCNPP